MWGKLHIPASKKTCKLPWLQIGRALWVCKNPAPPEKTILVAIPKKGHRKLCCQLPHLRGGKAQTGKNLWSFTASSWSLSTLERDFYGTPRELRKHCNLGSNGPLFKTSPFCPVPENPNSQNSNKAVPASHILITWCPTLYYIRLGGPLHLQILELLGTNQGLSSSHHPQTNGMTKHIVICGVGLQQLSTCQHRFHPIPRSHGS